YRHVLAQSARWVAEYPESTEARRMRFSFLSLERGDAPHLVAGEYGNTTPGDRLVRIGIGPDGALETDDTGLGVPRETHEPGLQRMQGACVVDGTWFVTTSNGER